MKKITPLLAIVVLWSCSTVRTSQLNSGTASNANGFYYALPKTILMASFEIEKKTIEAGKYSEYAPCFDIEVEETAGTSYKIKNMEITLAESDLERLHVEPVPGQNGNVIAPDNIR